MTRKEIGRAISRIFALFFLWKGVSSMIGFIGVKSGDVYIMIWSLSMVLLPLAFFIFFWLKAEYIGQKIIPSSSDETTGFLSYESCMDLVFVVFGLWLMSLSIPIIANLISYVLSDGLVQGQKLLGFNRFEKIVQMTLYICIGLFFIFRATGIRRFITGIKHAGQK